MLIETCVVIPKVSQGDMAQALRPLITLSQKRSLPNCARKQDLRR